MKGIFKFIIIVFVLMALVACDSAVNNPEAIKIGLIETTGSKKKSDIHWYDENLEELYVQNLRYARLGGVFSGRPVYFDVVKIKINLKNIK